MDNKKQNTRTPVSKDRKGNPDLILAGLRRPTPKLLAQPPATINSIGDELGRLKAAGAAVQRIRLSAQRELELARQMRVQAQKYQQETETKARSQAQLLILQARQATQKDIEELIRKASAEIQKLLADIRVIRITAQEEEELIRKTGAEVQKVLADIRMIRITAQEELETQRKFTGAAKIRALSLAAQGEPEKRTENKKVAVKV